MPWRRGALPARSSVLIGSLPEPQPVLSPPPNHLGPPACSPHVWGLEQSPLPLIPYCPPLENRIFIYTYDIYM